MEYFVESTQCCFFVGYLWGRWNQETPIGAHSVKYTHLGPHFYLGLGRNERRSEYILLCWPLHVLL